MKRCVPVLIAVVLVFMSTTAFGQHYEYVQTDANASNLILSATINDESLVEGDEVAAFTPDGLCAGAGIIPAGFPDSPLGFPAWGAEQGQDNGFHANERIEYRFWSVELDAEVVADGRQFVAGDGNWVVNGMNVVMLSGQHEEEPAPVIDVDPVEMDFGAILVGEEAVETLTITNTGDATLGVGDFDVANIDGEAFSFDVEIPEFPWEFVQTDNNMSVLVLSATLNGENLAAGDYIGVFTPEDLCAGYFEIVNPGEAAGVPAWGAEQGQVNGFRVNEEIQCRYWDSDPGREYVPDAQLVAGQNTYVPNGMMVVNLSAGDEFMPAIGGFELEPGESFEVDVLFAPDAADEFTGEIVIPSDDPDNAEVVVDLMGVGVLPDPEISIDVESIDFGELLVGENAIGSFTISNIGGGDLTVESVVITGDYYSLIGEDAFVIAPGESQRVSVSFDPEEAGEFEGEATVTSDDPNNGVMVIDLIGIGFNEALPNIAADPEAIDFGEVIIPMGDDQPNMEEVVLTISNVGDAPLTVVEAVLEGDGFFLDIDLGNGGGGEEFDWEFTQTDANMSILVQAATIDGEPLQPGDYIGTFTEGGLCAGFAEVQQAGAQLGVSAWGAEQGQQNGFQNGEAIEMRFFDTDPGTEYVAEYAQIIAGEPAYVGNGLLVCMLSAGDGFMPAEVVLEPGAEVQGTVFFGPDAAGEYNGTITISSDDPDGDLVVELTGVGILPAAEIEVDAEGHDFGGVAVGASADWAFTITNVGGDDLNVDDVVVAGDYFSSDVGEGFALATGESREVTVTFAPEDAGEFEGSVTITSDDEDEPEIVLGLAGVGEVDEFPVIAVDNDNINFGDMWIGEVYDDLLVISNEGNAPLTIIDVTVEGEGFSIDVDLGGDEFVEFPWEFVQTDVNMSTLIQTMDFNGEPLGEGNYVGVFTENGTCAGFGEVVEAGAAMGVPAWGAEQGQQNGFVANEAIEFRFWETDPGREYVADVQALVGEPIYVANGFFVCNLSVGDANMPAELVLDPDATLEVPVFFNPEELGEYEGAITITSDDPENEEVVVGLFGVGIMDPPAIDIVDMDLDGELAHDFGVVQVGQTDDWRITIGNLSQHQDLDVESIVVDGDYFYIDVDDGFIIEPGDARDVTATFEPEEGGEFGATLTITSNDEQGHGEIVINLTGVGEVDEAPDIAVDNDVIDFGEVVVGEEGEDLLVITNEGNAPLTIEEVIVEGDGFTIEVDLGGGFEEFPWEYVQTDVNMSTLIQSVEFNGEPLGEGNYVGVFTEDGTCAGFGEVEQAGEAMGVPAWGAEQGQQNGFQANEAIEFRVWETDPGREYVAECEALMGEAVYVANGLLVCNLSAGDGFMPAELVLEPDATLEVPVFFNPEEAGNYEGAITIISDDPDEGEVVVGLLGVGVLLQPSITLSEDGFDFGVVELGSSSEAILRVGNEGEADLIVESFVVDGDYFYLDFEGERVIGPDESFDLGVIFEPEDAGEFGGTLTITSNDPENGEIVLELSGEGIAVDEPDIAVNNDVIDFGGVLVGEEAEDLLVISNEGNAPLTIEDVTVEGDGFTIDVDLGGGFVEFEWEYVQTDVNMSTLIQQVTFNGEPLGEGNYVGVFTENGTCAGFGEVEQAGEAMGVPAWGAEQGQQNGFQANEAIEFRFWETDPGREYVADVQALMGEPIYVANGLFVCNLSVGDGNMPAEVVLDPGGTLEVPVFFNPEEEMEYEGAITIISDDPDDEEVIVQLLGVGEVEEEEQWIGFDPEAVEFDPVLIGEQGEATLTIFNMSEEDELIIDDMVIDNAVFSFDDGQMQGEFDWEFEQTDGNMSIIVQDAAINGEQLVEGDYIGVFTPAGLCAGYSQVPESLFGEGGVGVSAWGAEQGQQNGFANREDIEFHIWDTDAGRDYVAEPDIGFGEPVYVLNGFLVLAGLNAGRGMNPADMAIEPGGSVEIPIYFNPEEAIEYNGTLTVMSNDPVVPEAEVELTGNGAAPAADIDVSDEAYDFEAVNVGESEDWTFTISNIGGSDLTVESVDTDGDGFEDNIDEGFVLESGGSQEVMVTFSPDAPGDFAGTVTIASDDEDEGEIVVDLAGTGFLDPPNITLSAEAYDFEELLVGESDEWSFEIGNDGETDLVVESISVDGEFFSIDVENGFTLEPGEVEEVTVTFAPEDDGEFESTITIVSNDPDGDAHVMVVGSAVWFPLIALDPDDIIDFGELEINGLGEGSVNISNPGGAPLTVTDVVVEGDYFFIEEDDDEPRDFDWEFVQTDNNMSIIIQDAAIGDDQLVEGDYIGVFTEGGMCAGYSEIPEALFGGGGVGLSAWGAEQGQQNGFANQEDIEFRIWDLDAGREYVGDPEIGFGEPIYVPNGFLVLAGLNAEGGMNPAFEETVIEPGGSIDLPVFFQPEEAGEFEGSLTVFSDARDMEEVSIDLFGVAQERILMGLSGEEWNFGELLVDESSDWVLNIENIGEGDLVIESIDVEGDYFSFEGDDDGVLEPGENIVLNVFFEPEVAGEFVGMITIESNAANYPDGAEVTLTGTAIWFPIIRLDPEEEIDFGAVPNETEVVEVLRIFNDGRASLTVDEILIDGDGFALGAFQEEEPGEFEWEYVQTDINASILVTEANLDGEPLIEGDFIGVFTEDGLCAGFTEVSANFPNEPVGIPAWGAEQGEDNGFQNGEAIGYRFWDNDAGREYVADANYLQGNGNWVGNAFFVVRLNSEVGDAPMEIAEVIDPGSFADVEVFFRPEESGEYQGIVTVISDDHVNGELSINLLGNGYVPPIIVGPEDGHIFDELLVGEEATWPFTIGNDGEVDLEVESVTVLGDYFSIDPDDDFTVAPGEEQELTVTFAPEDAGEFDGNVVLVSNDPDTPELIIDISGSAVWFPIIALDPDDEIDFGRMFDGGQVDEVVEVANVGQVPLTITDISVDGDGFALGDIDVENPIEIEPDGTIEVPVMFLPDDEGEFNGTLTIVSNDPDDGEVSVDLVGVGFFTPPEIEVSDDALDFEGVVVGQTGTMEFTIANVGQLPLEIEEFALEGQYFSTEQEDEFVIERDGELVIEVNFAPELRGDYEGMITFETNDDDTPEVTIDLVGAGLAPVVDVDPMAIDFGEVFVDEEDNREIIVTNNGDADLVISDLVLDNDAYSFEPPEQGEFDWAFVQSDVNMNVLVLDGILEGRELAEGDVIGVFTDDGICGGFADVPEDIFEAGVGIAVWADEAGGEVTGFAANQTLNFRIWDISANREYEADADYVQGDDVWTPNGFSVVNLSAGNGFEPADLVIAPDESEELILFFRPTEGIEYEATLTVVNNDPEAPEVVVDINGEGRIRNGPPIWVDVPEAIETDEDTDYSITFEADDPDDDPMTITFVDRMENLPDEASFEDNGDGTGTFSWRTDFESEGEYEFGLTVEDDHNNVAFTVVALSVNNVNRAPIWINPIDAAEAFEDERLEIFMESMDPDGQDLTMDYDFEFEVEEFTDHGDGSCTFIWATDFESAGEHVVTFSSSDGDLTTENDVTITVIDVNRPPEVPEGIDDFEIAEDAARTAIADLDDVFFDPDGDELEFSIENIDDLGYLGLDIDGGNLLTVHPDENYFGDSDVVLVADDGREGQMFAPIRVRNNAVAFSSTPISRSVRGVNNTPAAGPNRDDTATDEFTLTVTSVNDAPFVDVEIDDVTVDEDSGVITIDLSGVFDDVDHQELTYTLSGAPDELNGNIDGEELTFDPAENFNIPDGAEITVTAEDGDGATAEDDFVVTINPVNDPPVVAEPIGDLFLEEDPGRVILADLDDVFMDVDGDNLEYTFETDSEELNLGMDNNFNLFINPVEDFTTPNEPVYVFLTATDPSGETVEYEFAISILPENDPPIVENEINDVAIDEDSQAILMTDLDDNFFDIDGQRLTYSIAGAPDEINMEIEDGTNILFFHPDADYNLPGGVDITITATDPGDLSVDDVFNLIIRAVNDAPTWVEFPEDVLEVEEGELLEIDLVAGDIDSEELTISWVDANGLPEESLTDNGDGTATIAWEPTFEDAGEFLPVLQVSDDQYETELEISIMVIEVPQLQHFVDFVQTEANHTLLIEDVEMDGATVPSLWEVGVFNGDGTLAGAFLWDEEEGRVGGPVWGDDPQTDEIDGMRDNEEMNFVIWDFEIDAEFAATAEVLDGSVNWTANGFAQLNLGAFEVRDLAISFTRGWNLVSMNIVPEDQYWSEDYEEGPDIVLMLEQLAGDGERNNILLIKNDRGRFYHPRSGFRNLRYWDLGEGYAIRMQDPIDGSWSGTPIAPDEPVTVSNGWNYVPYYPNYLLNARAPDFYVLSDIIENVRLAKSGAGRFMAPHVRFSNMDPWEPGQGYQVKMQNLDGETQFSYPPEPEEEVAMIGGIETGTGMHYIEPENTGENMSVLISTIVDFPFSSNDQIAAYNADGRIVGTAMVDEDGRCGMAVWGTDQTSEEINGLQQGEAFELKLWDADRGVEVGLMSIAILEGSGLDYETDGFVMLELGVKPDVPETYFLSKAYPNPFNSTTRLTYGMTETGHASVNVFDMNGRLVANLVDGTVDAGYHNVLWGGADLAAGVYMIHFEAAGFKSVSKVVLMK